MEELQKMLNEVKCLKIDYDYDIGIDFEKAQSEIDMALQLLQTDVSNCDHKDEYGNNLLKYVAEIELNYCSKCNSCC